MNENSLTKEQKRKILRSVASLYDEQENMTCSVFKKNLLCAVLLCFSVLLFCLANPNEIVKNGIGFLCLVYYVPVLFIVNCASIKNVWVYGFLYGFFSYFIYLNWIKSYGTAALYALCVFYGLILALVFFLLKATEYFFKWGHKNGSGYFVDFNPWLMQWCILCLYEYLKARGTLGLNYGVSAYCLWKYVPFIQSAKIFGVFGLNCFVILFSAAVYSILKKRILFRHIENKMSYFSENGKIKSHIKFFHSKKSIRVLYSVKLELIAFFIILCSFVGSVLMYEKSAEKKSVESMNNQIKVAAIQNNDDPWNSDVNGFAAQIQKMISLTKEAIELNPDIKIVIWPETAVVPAIVYNYQTKREERRLKMIESLLDFIEQTELTFVIGNGHYSDFEGNNYKRYNSTLVLTGGKNALPPKPEIYCKNHLVPFSEYFPWKESMPYIYKKYFKDNKIRWEPGTEINIFNREGLNFATPICFEDTFSDLCRRMVNEGADCFFNVSNDSWASSGSCQIQHLAMAVFRSVENSVYSVRSTASGETCIISSTGEIVQRCKPFSESYVTGYIPLAENWERCKSFYTVHGDFLIGFMAILFFSLLLIKIFTVIIDIIYLRKKYG